MLQYRDCMKTLVTRMDTGIYVYRNSCACVACKQVTEFIHAQAGRYHSLKWQQHELSLT